jgi:hypothetical protein
MPQSYGFFFAYNFPWEGIRLLVTTTSVTSKSKTKRGQTDDIGAMQKMWKDS